MPTPREPVWNEAPIAHRGDLLNNSYVMAVFLPLPFFFIFLPVFSRITFQINYLYLNPFIIACFWWDPSQDGCSLIDSYSVLKHERL